MSRQAEIKVQLLKFVEVSYKHNKGVTTKLVTGQVNVRELLDQCEWGLCKYRFKRVKLIKRSVKLGFS